MYSKMWISQFCINEGLSVVNFKEFCEAWQHGSVRRRGIKCICFGRNFSTIHGAAFLLVVVFFCVIGILPKTVKMMPHFFCRFWGESRQKSKNW